MVHHGCFFLLSVFFCPPCPPTQQCIFAWNIDFKFDSQEVMSSVFDWRLVYADAPARHVSPCLWTECCLINVLSMWSCPAQKKAPKSKRTKEHTKAQPSLVMIHQKLVKMNTFEKRIQTKKSTFPKSKFGAQVMIYPKMLKNEHFWVKNLNKTIFLPKIKFGAPSHDLPKNVQNQHF